MKIYQRRGCAEAARRAAAAGGACSWNCVCAMGALSTLGALAPLPAPGRLAACEETKKATVKKEENEDRKKATVVLIMIVIIKKKETQINKESNNRIRSRNEVSPLAPLPAPGRLAACEETKKRVNPLYLCRVKG